MSMMTDAVMPGVTRSGLVPVGATRWRVLDRAGLVCGHVEAVTEAAGIRFRAQRFHVASRSFRVLGDFWTAREAVECVRLSR